VGGSRPGSSGAADEALASQLEPLLERGVTGDVGEAGRVVPSVHAAGEPAQQLHDPPLLVGLDDDDGHRRLEESLEIVQVLHGGRA